MSALKAGVAADRKSLSTTIHKEILDLKLDMERNFLAMAERLTHYVDEKLYVEQGFESFEEYVEAEPKDHGLGWDERKAYYFVKIWRKWVLEAGVKPEKILRMTWTKAGEVAGVVTKGNAERWLKKATEEPLADLRQDIKKERAKQQGRTVDEMEEEEEVFAITFKLAKPQFETVQQAFGLAQRIAKSNVQSHLLDRICLAYTSQNLSPEPIKNLIPMLEGIERVYGVDITARKDGQVFYGKMGNVS